MRRRVLGLLAFGLAFACAPHKAVITIPSHIDIKPSDMRLVFGETWPEEFEVCFEMERTGARPCLTVRELRLHYARMARVEP